MGKKLWLFFACMIMSTGIALAQRAIKGSVVDANTGETIIGASVRVEGTKLGTVTDIDGKFNFQNVPENAKNVIVIYVGYKEKKAAINPSMKISLSPEVEALNEVVVQGMRSMDKRMFTGATTQIQAVDANIAGIADVSRSLEGRVAGVTIQNVSGTFGSAPKIRVRGATSIYGTSSPLWVIDGVIQENAIDVSPDQLSSGDASTLIANAIAGLNADDIENFQILKDGSATSIYGARAMAGVIVITTKRGKAGTSSVSYTGEFSTRMKPSYRDYNICNSQEQMGIYKELEQKGILNFASLAVNSSSGIYGTMYKEIVKYNSENHTFDFPYEDGAMARYLQEGEYRNTDWFDLLFKNSISQNHSVSVSTGTEKASLYASLSYLNDPGWTAKSEVKRYTANVNASFQLSKNLNIEILSNANYRDQEAPGTLARTVDPVHGDINRDFDINPFSYALNTSRVLDPNSTITRNFAPFNIFDELENNYINLKVSDIKFQGQVAWKPIKSLELKAMMAYRTETTNNEHFILNHSNQAEAYRAGVGNPNVQDLNKYLYSDPDKPGSDPVSVMPQGGIYLSELNKLSQYDLRLSGDWKKFWNEEKHFVDVYFGMEANKTDRDKTFRSEYGVDYENARLVINTPEFFKQASEENSELGSFTKKWVRHLAYFASGTYSYDQRYTLNLTGRYEGSNKLGKSQSARWLGTWNVSGAWNVHEENFFKKFMEKTDEWFSNLTLRYSYSLTADRGPDFVTNALPVFKSKYDWRPYSDQMEMSIELNDNANSELTYEKKKEHNIGFDLGFFKNRINFNFDIWWRDNHDLIGQTSTQGVYGFIRQFANVANMKSHGLEFGISSQNIVNDKLKWTSDFTFSYAKDKITNLLAKSKAIDLITGESEDHFREGYPVSALFSIPFVSLNDEGIPQFINQDGVVTTTDINFQEMEKLDFLKYEGPTEPPYTGGLNNTVTYKNWRFNIYFTYAFGNKVRLYPSFAYAYSDQTASPREFKNRWVVPGDEKITNVPAILSLRQINDEEHYADIWYAYSAYNYSTERIAKGDFIRLKDISVTYNLPAKLLEKVGLSNAYLRLSGSNLLLLYSDKKLNGQDPEFVNSGGVAMPLSREFTFTLHLGI